MEKIKHYQKQFSRATERAFSDRGMDEISAEVHLATLFKKGESKFNRTVALLGMLRKILPEGVLKFNYKTDDLPFDPERYEFNEGALGRGGENDVYRLEAKKNGEPSWALKINHQDRGDVKSLTARAKEISQEYEMVKDWYDEIEGLVPREWTMILAGPRDGQAAIATIQEYYGTRIRDVFKEVDADELTTLLGNQPQLKADFENFLRISREQVALTGNTIDLLGDKNLSLIKKDDEERLIILDPHLISNPVRKEAEIKTKLEAKLAYLEQVIEAVPRDRMAVNY